MLLREDKSQKPNFTYVGLLYGAMARVMARFTLGEEKYARGNWKEAREVQTYRESATRHLFQYLSEDKSEDHLAAACANLLILLDLEELGVLSAEARDVSTPKESYLVIKTNS